MPYIPKARNSRSIMDILKKVWLFFIYSPIMINELYDFILFLKICFFLGYIPHRYREVDSLLPEEIISLHEFDSVLFTILSIVFLVSIVFGITCLIRTRIKKERQQSNFFLIHLIAAFSLTFLILKFGFGLIWFYC